MARTDIHRESAFVASDYDYVLSYSLSTSQDGWPIPSYHVNCELDYRQQWTDENGKFHVVNGKHSEDGRCCVIGLLHISGAPMAKYGNTGKCTLCGAHFIYGEVWQHKHTKEYVHIGHQCADKVGLASHDEQFKGKRLNFVSRVIRIQRREKFLADHPGLGDALTLNHRILRDMSERLDMYGALSDKQIAFALKLAEEVRNPKEEEAKVPAPEGRHTWEGQVVSVKQGDYGYRLILKTETPNGVWLAMGSCPSALVGCVQRGDAVRLTATLAHGKDEHFAFYKRPSGAEKIIK